MLDWLLTRTIIININTLIINIKLVVPRELFGVRRTDIPFHDENVCLT